MAWNSAIVVNSGLEMLNQAAGGGGTLYLDCASGGSGTAEAHALMAQTFLVDQKQTFPIVDARTVDKGRRLNIMIRNEGLRAAYDMQQLGIWAHMDDGPTRLFAILQDARGISIPAQSDMPDFALNFYAVIKYSGEVSFSLTIDPSALVSQGTLAAALEEKQDKLSGTKGQVVGFDADGQPMAVDTPDTIVISFNGRSGAVTPKDGDYTADMVGARPSDWTPSAGDVGAVPTTRKVNGKALSENISLSASDVGARPSTWTPTAADVGARPSTWTPTAADVGALPSGGTAAAAEKLDTARSIDGVEFDGSGDCFHYGICATAGSTAAKTVELAGFKLEAGARVAVKFTNTNTASSPTLNVNSTGAKYIKKYGTTAPDTYMWYAGAVVGFVYDGSYWIMLGGTTATTTYYGVTKLSSSTSSTSTALAATPSAVKAAYDLAAGKQSKPLSGTVTIPTTGWGSDSTATYPKYYDIAVTGVTASDRASVDIATASMSTAVACGLCPSTETMDGKIRIRAVSVPGAAMTANYWIEKGA